MIRQKPKVAILSIRNSYGFGGVFSTLKVVYNFSKKYFNPTVFYASFDPEISAHLRGLKFRSTSRDATFFGMDCVEIGSKWAFWEPGHYSFSLKKWHEKLKDFDYFFVVSATPIAGHPLALMDKKFVMWISTSYDQDRTERVKELRGLRWLINKCAEPLMRKIEYKVLSKASYILALSNYSKTEFSKILKKPKKELGICGYPLDQSLSPNLQKNFTEKTIIAVGRFSDPRKNIHMLIKAFRKIHAQVPLAHLYIIGKEPDVETLRIYNDNSDLENISFIGQISPADLRRFYQEASLILVTSYQEGFGIAALESVFYGTPIISTDCGGPRDFVINGYNGYIVDINDDESMAMHAIKLLTDHKLSAEFSHNGHFLAEALFKESKIFSHFKYALTQVYPELTEYFEAIDSTEIKTKNTPHIDEALL